MLETIKIKLLKLLLNNIFKYNQNECQEKWLETTVDDLTYFEKKNKMTIDIISDPTLIIPEYIIDIKNKSLIQKRRKYFGKGDEKKIKIIRN